MYIHGHFYNEKDEKIEVHILTHDERTEELEIGAKDGTLFFTDDPVEITTEVNDTFDVLLCHQATVRLLTRNFVEDFFCSSAKDAVINIYRSGTCLFAGYIEPQTYSQDYNEQLDQIELSCIDALTVLQYGKYREIGSLGVPYSVVKGEAVQRSFIDIIKEILDGAAAQLDILGKQTLRYWYDGSKAVDSATDNRHSIFTQLAINELLFLGDQEDDVYGQDEVLQEILKYLNLHIVQDGLQFYIFAWESVKGEQLCWRDLLTSDSRTDTIASTDINTHNVIGTDAAISVPQTYNQILLTCDIKAIESVIESPLDDDLLVSPFANKQKYITEYSADGEGVTAINAFDAITHGKDTDYSGGRITDWYLQVKNNPQWAFPDKGGGNIMETYCADGKNQQMLPNMLAKQIAAGIVAFGKVQTSTDGKDNSPVSKVDMTNYLVVSVNGNGIDNDENNTFPSEQAIKEAIPVAIYNGNTAGGAFSPADEDTTNYIVFSGKIVLNPIMELTDTYKAIYNYTPTDTTPTIYQYGILQWWGQTVPSRDNADGRYYTQQWWKAETPASAATWDQDNDKGLLPFTETGPRLCEFKYSAIGDGTDQISKVAVLQCMLVIGDKCVVETGTQGRTSDFQWKTYKERSECDSDDEYYQQSFTIGFDPKIGDRLIGTSFDMQNNIDYTMGIDAEGIAIPIRKDDKVSGDVKFMILGPVNTTWDVITRRHPTFFRHTKWGSSTVPLLAHVSSILVEQFEIKVYSDNGLVNNTGENDIIYMSDTKETFVNRKDDIEFKISSALTSAEARQLGVTDSVKMSTPTVVSTGEALMQIYDYSRKTNAKAEQLYVDSYYQEWHAPRIELTQKLEDTHGGIVSLFAHYRHPAMKRTFFVQGISRNLEQAYAEMTLKEIDN